ncbi:hypothetical protein A3J41_03310 [candidate division TM6 bacterium RIFCSPHIGHO2_12_FULL_38_8]|nr:MAG: hypothetical protein A3J41_03310 [candidate division TM6 bacterium RIFCSPHIGHO2_12_FULL_38_8]
MQKATKIIISLAFLYHSFFQASICDDKPLLVVITMVKNEASVMEATLKPFLEAGLQHFLVLDTGSNDKTVSVVQNLFKKYKVSHGHVIEEPFVNFAVSRNFALEQAENIFPNAVFFLFIDAEWYMHNVEGLLKFCAENQKHKSRAFLVKRVFPLYNASDCVNWLFKAHKGIRFLGVVHEHINDVVTVKVPDDVFITVDPSRCGNEKSAERWKRDLGLLLKEHEQNPHHMRTIFLIAQTYGCLKQYEQAIAWYKKRCKIKKDNEEIYQALYRIALLYQALENWPQALIFHFKAYAARPQRIDSLVRIAQYFTLKKDYDPAFLVAHFAAKMPVPSGEQLLIMPELYEFTRYEIVSQVAWYVGEYEIGRWATLKALDYNATVLALHKKLLLYEKALNHCECTILNGNFWCDWCNGSLWLTRPSWFNYCCLAYGPSRSNRCNLSHGIAWRSWFGLSTMQ